ncbi:Transmembrane 9 superfamily member 5 [Linum perenne]
MTLHHIAAAVVLAALTFFSVGSAAPSPPLRRYNAGDDVPLFANKVGPFHNPSETYQYYELPFCRPDRVVQKKQTLGEVLNGDRLTSAPHELKFLEKKSRVTLCERKLGLDDVLRLRRAVINDYYFQMYYDDLPLWGFVGKVEEQSWLPGGDDERLKYYLFKHLMFDVVYNGDQVIEITAIGDPTDAVDITEDVEIDVKFVSSNGDEEEDKEVGWKYIHGDVFRHPQNMSLFCAVLATGAQLLTMFFLLFILAFVDVLYPYSRGGLYTACVFVYALTSVVGGYTSASFHSQFEVTGWGKSVFLTGILYLGPLFTVMSFLNTVAVSYGATAGLPFGTIMVIVLICVFLAFPLLILGGIIGYTFRSEFQAPSPPKRHPREIPGMGWYRRTPSQMLLAGLLPTSAVALELHSLYTSLWGYKIYTLPSILFVTFIILCLLTAILSIGMTYIQLSVEDHRWWWRSVLRGGSPAIFMYLYSIFFFSRSSMSGVLQTSFFFGYSACLCYAVFLMLGTVSFCASFIFVCRIYRAVKNE